jgi:hypothetical protein
LVAARFIVPLPVGVALLVLVARSARPVELFRVAIERCFLLAAIVLTFRTGFSAGGDSFSRLVLL